MSTPCETVRFVQWLQHQNDAASDMRSMTPERLEAELWAWRKRQEAPLPPSALERDVEREHAKATTPPAVKVTHPIDLRPVTVEPTVERKPDVPLVSQPRGRRHA